jgi:sulfur carrier protein
MSDEVKFDCTINGVSYTLLKGFSLSDFLKEKNVPEGAVVVEFNGTILPRGNYEGVILSDGDKIEIVQIIGGG